MSFAKTPAPSPRRLVVAHAGSPVPLPERRLDSANRRVDTEAARQGAELPKPVGQNFGEAQQSRYTIVPKSPYGKPVPMSVPMLSCPLLCLPIPEKNKRLRCAQSDEVIYGMAEFLFAAQVALGCLHGDMPQQELNLFQFTAGKMTQACTCSAQIMRSKIL